MTTLAWSREGPAWPHHEASRFVDAAGVHWHVQAMGRGPALLLLHGTGASSHSWRDLAPQLARRHRVWTVDLPGHAFSSALPEAACSLPGMASATAQLLRALRVHPRAVLGHSAGAALMLRMALDRQLEDCTLVGLNAALLPFEGWAGALFPPLARWLARSPWAARLAAWRAQDPSAVRWLIAATGSRIDDDGIALYRRLMQAPEHVAGVLAMMANWDLQTLLLELPRLQRPLHLMVGTLDSTVPPTQARAVAARVPQVQVHELARLGHLAHEEAPAAVAERLLELLR